MLWSTVASAVEALQYSELSYEIIVVADGTAPDIAAYLHRSKLCSVIYANAGSPQAARHIGACEAQGDVLFFADAHVLFPEGFFWDVLEDMRKTCADLMHTPHRFLGNTFYGFHVDWNGYLWSAQNVNGPVTESFKIAVAGHGAFAIRKDSYLKAGGYWQALKGFGGEETQLNFKLWLMGMTCWMTARTYHWHWMPPAGRHTDAMFRDKDFVRNFLMVAAAYGGPEQLERSYRAFVLQHWEFKKLYHELMSEVWCSNAVCEERAFIAEHCNYETVHGLREMFIREGVVN